ncbi:MAG TPA: C25 family cysteine peptidase [Pyrinomonadaceae bacterium]|nr:C25 family cysteine peptidase [Pyrinomonadaceae bacterium]
MRRILSASLIYVLLCAFALPVTSQRESFVKNSKPGAENAATQFESVSAYTEGSGVLVEWRMAIETDNAGFFVHRIDGHEAVIASDSMILGSSAFYGAKPAKGQSYSYFDPEGTPGSVYFVEHVAMNGTRRSSGTASATFVPDLSRVSPAAGVDRARQVAESKRNSVVISEGLELPKDLYREVADSQVAADANAHAWVVAQPGVRIGVRREGFHRVTKAELEGAGFNTNGDTSLWQLYREGVQQSIIVGPNGSYMDFYGKGIDRPETETAIYYLVSGPSAGKRIATRVARPLGGTVTSRSYLQQFVQKQRTNYVNQILNGDAENYWGAVISTGGNTTINFNLTGVDFQTAEATLLAKFQGFSFDQHIVQVTLNGHLLPSATGNSRSAFSRQYTIPTSHLQEGANSIVFRSIGVQTDFSLFDSISIGFARKHLASQNQLKFYTQNYRLAKLDGFSSANIRVFDTTNETEPVMFSNLNIVQEGATHSVRMPADRGRSMFAVEESGLLPAATITPNDPAFLKTPANEANVVIIAHKNWMPEAQNWANYRTNQGFIVKLVEISDIYDEFSYGDLDSLAIRSFLQYAKNNWQTPPGYALLIGDASYDSRNYQGFGYNNFVPTRIVNTIFSETGSDDFLADFNSDGLADMAIGRITARDGQSVTNALAKVTAWEANLPTLQNRGALFAYDCFDAANNYNFQQISNNLKNQLPGGVPSTMVGRCDSTTPPATPQTVLIDGLNTGKFVVNYAGHGTTGAWAATSFFANGNVPQLTNASNQSLFTMLTCLNGYFLHPVNKSLAENLVDSTTGGAVASWASTGETTPDIQEVMATRFFQRLGQGQIQRLGDLVNDAKTVIPGGTDVRLSWALLGDPVLKVRNPTVGDRPSKNGIR